MGGIFAAAAVTVMAMGTIIPVATYVCPVICMLLLQFVLKNCGSRIGWAWYGAVAVLSVLLAPDKEAALIFCFIGYYPIIRPWMEKRAGKWLWKAAYFNSAILAAYYLMLRIFDIEQVADDLKDVGIIMTIVLLLLGNITFFLFDRLLRVGVRHRFRG